jgi:hypothetical protein
MIYQFPSVRANEITSRPACEHRMVSKDGRIVCSKIGQGENAVSPDLCRACPFQAVNCQHLRFSLQVTTPSPLVVRFNGRTEVWNDEPARLCLRQAACAQLVTPIEQPRVCAACPLRRPIQEPAQATALPAAARLGRVVVFPAQEPAAAAG